MKINNNNKNTDGITIIILDNGMEIKTRNPHGTEGIIGMITNAISKATVTDIHGNKVDVRGINTITFASSLLHVDDPRRVLRKNYDCKLNDYDGDDF